MSQLYLQTQTWEILGNEGIGGFAGLLMQSSVACSGSVVYSEATSKPQIALKSLATTMKCN